MRRLLPTHALIVLDIGHGNAAVLLTPEGVGVIDSGVGPALLELLEELEVYVVDWLLLSHADKDHIGGALALLTNTRFQLKRLRVNPDSTKGSLTWDHLVYEADAKGDLDFRPILTPESSGEFDFGNVKVEVLTPSSYLAAKGAGGRDLQDRQIGTNSLSAIFRVSGPGHRVLLSGDLDRIGLDDALNHKVDLSSETLVWPHHGGNSGQAAVDSFVTDLCDSVSPSFVVFSIGRNKFQNPKPEIVEGLRRHLGTEPRIACTQLSRNCAQNLNAASHGHRSPVFAAGRESGESCAGTIVVDLNTGAVAPEAAEHSAFIRANAPMALCMKQWDSN